MDLLCHVMSVFTIIHSVLSASFVTSWTAAHQAPLSMGFSRQEYWSGLLCPPPGDLPYPRIEPMSSALPGRFFTPEPLGKPPHVKSRCRYFRSIVVVPQSSQRPELLLSSASKDHSVWSQPQDHSIVYNGFWSSSPYPCLPDDRK